MQFASATLEPFVGERAALALQILFLQANNPATPLRGFDDAIRHIHRSINQFIGTAIYCETRDRGEPAFILIPLALK